MSENKINRFSQDPEAVKARAQAAAKSRAEAKSKDDLIEVLQGKYSAIIGNKVSKTDAWKLFKVSIKAPIEVSRSARLSLSGVGTFEILSSKRSEAVGKEPLRPKFRPSTSIIEIVNSDKSLLDDAEVSVENSEDMVRASKEVAEDKSEAKVEEVEEDIL